MFISIIKETKEVSFYYKSYMCKNGYYDFSKKLLRGNLHEGLSPIIVTFLWSVKLTFTITNFTGRLNKCDTKIK